MNWGEAGEPPGGSWPDDRVQKVAAANGLDFLVNSDEKSVWLPVLGEKTPSLLA